MQVMNCLILEDEPLAVNVLKEYISIIPELKLIEVCEDAFTALSVLRNEKIDLLFVDINLPKLSGIDFIKSLNKNYSIILTTAYHEFALDAYNLNVVDYLLKPIEFSRFLQAVDKVCNRNLVQQKTNLDEPGRKFHFFNVDKKQVKVFSEEIIYIESFKDYVKIHLTNRSIITKYKIGTLAEILEKEKFIRIHKSFIINADKISSVSATEVEIGAVIIPVGRVYKEELYKLISES